MFTRKDYEPLDNNTWSCSQVLAIVAAVSVSLGATVGLVTSSASQTNLASSGLTTAVRPTAQTTVRMPIHGRLSGNPIHHSDKALPHFQDTKPEDIQSVAIPSHNRGPSISALLLVPITLAGVVATLWHAVRKPVATPVDPLELVSTTPKAPVGCVYGGHRIDYAMMAISGKKVAVLGGAGGIGQPLALLLKGCDMVSHLSVYDLANFTPGVAVDLSHINTPCTVSGHKGAEELEAALEGADVVVIPAGVARKPGMTRDDLFNTNASIIASLAGACAKVCPKAILVLIANPVNSLVPVAAEVMKKAGVHDPRKVIGVTSLDVTRANTWVGEMNGENPREQNVVVVGGHAGTTILPLLSQVPGSDRWSDEQIKALTNRIQFGGEEVVKAKDGAGSATLSMAYSGAEFVRQILRAINGEQGIVECCYTENNVTEASFFATPTTLGPNGAESVTSLPELSAFEQEGLDSMLPDLKAQIAKGVEFAKSL